MSYRFWSCGIYVLFRIIFNLVRKLLVKRRVKNYKVIKFTYFLRHFRDLVRNFPVISFHTFANAHKFTYILRHPANLVRNLPVSAFLPVFL